MHFYGMGYREVMTLPARVFWFINQCVRRMLAERDVRTLTVMNAAQSAEGAQTVRDQLIVEMGEVEKQDPVAEAQLDRAGFEMLRRMQ